MKKCPNGHEVNDNLKFCPKCGAVRNESQEPNGNRFSKPLIVAFAVLTILIGSYFVIDIVSPETHNKLFGSTSSNSSSSIENPQSGKTIYSGTYRLDGGYSLTISKDQTARLYTPDGTKFAASVKCWVADYVSINIDWDVENPLKIKGESVFVPVIGKEKDYFYYDVSAYKSKNENKRIRITSFSK